MTVFAHSYLENKGVLGMVASRENREYQENWDNRVIVDKVQMDTNHDFRNCFRFFHNQVGSDCYHSLQGHTL